MQRRSGTQAPVRVNLSKQHVSLALQTHDTAELHRRAGAVHFFRE